MTILWLIALPLLTALLVFLLRDLRLLPTVLSIGALLAMAVFLIAVGEAEPVIVLGRSTSLSAEESVALAFSCAILAIAALHTYWIGRGELAYPLTLAGVGLFVAATMIRNVIIAAVLLQIGTVLAVMLIPSRRAGSAMAGMRVLVLSTLSGFSLLVAAWAVDSQAMHPDNGLLSGVSTLSLVAGFAFGLGLVPFYLWHPAVFFHGSTLAVTMMNVVLGVVLLLHLDSMLGMASWSGMRDLVAMLLIGGGMVTGVAGCLMAAPQRSVGRALAYAGLADLGLVAVGLGIGTEQSIRAATLHLAHRGTAVLLSSMALAMLRQSLGTDALEDIWGAWRRVPWAVIGIAIGGLSLVGLPLTAGFSTRFLLYRAVAARNTGWVILLIASTMGPVWFFVRFLTAALTSAPTTAGRRARLGSKLLVMGLTFCLLFLGVWPGFWSVILGRSQLAFFQSLARLP